MCTRYPIINRVSELKVHIELTRFVQPEKIEIDANERAVNEKSPYCFFVCTTFDSFLNDLLRQFSLVLFHRICLVDELNASVHAVRNIRVGLIVLTGIQNRLDTIHQRLNITVVGI